MVIEDFQQAYCKFCKNKLTGLCEIVKMIDGRYSCKNFERENIEADCVFLKNNGCKALIIKECENCKFYLNKKQ